MDKIYSLFQSILRFLLVNIPFIKSQKFKTWQEGQKNILKTIRSFKQNSILFIVASNGEFEQALPVIELIQKNFPKFPITIAFYSPSGIITHQNKKDTLQITYLPYDDNNQIKAFIDSLKPVLVLFVKYELWYNLMRTLRLENIPRILFSAVFNANHFLFKWYGQWHRKELSHFNKIFVQNKASQDYLIKYNIQSTVAGDTRIDRSLELPSIKYENAILDGLNKSSTKLILGSVWENDIIHFDRSVIDWLNDNNVQLIIAPHELDQNFIDSIQNKFDALLYSELQENKSLSYAKRHIIIDQIGILKYIYRYGHIAYIGGGFGTGIHNILEPASYALPILFGPKYQKFVEAHQLIEQKAAFSIDNSAELVTCLQQLITNKQYYHSGKRALNYLEENKGASKIIFNKIKNYLE